MKHIIMHARPTNPLPTRTELQKSYILATKRCTAISNIRCQQNLLQVVGNVNGVYFIS